ncbi:MAG: RNA methyltransferase [Magnetococcales bacterium]|nr:RNA methyltransferase [Magnetococcales bacterium]NGZ29085.1 RNA methyltransferase [Magnetococcales bacterium]
MDNKPVIILDRPAHAGNIGAVLRAMYNMGFQQLRLVAPRQFPHPEVADYAVHALDLLERVEVFATLDEALADVEFLVATTNRPRGHRQRSFTPRQLAAGLPELSPASPVVTALLFGTERSGLETVDILRAHAICHIPTWDGQSSLNLSHAVLVVLYELMLGWQEGKTFAFDPLTEDKPATVGDMERLFVHMQETLAAIDFIKQGQEKHMMASLRTLFNRAALDRREVSILRGILNEVIDSHRRGLKHALPD